VLLPVLDLAVHRPLADAQQLRRLLAVAARQLQRLLDVIALHLRQRLTDQARAARRGVRPRGRRRALQHLALRRHVVHAQHAVAAIAFSRSRCVAEMSRTLTRIGSLLPMRVTSRFSITRSSFACSLYGMSPISSRKTVPPLAYSKSPLRCRSPPV